MRVSLISVAVLLLLGACGYVSEYEKAVYDYKPVYCYQSIGKVQCFDKPNPRDQRRLVNYYGPHPSRYDQPEARPAVKLSPPPAVDFYVRDPEPIPGPGPAQSAKNAKNKSGPSLDKAKGEDKAKEEDKANEAKVNASSDI